VADLKKYNMAGKEVGHVSLEDELLKSDANSQMIKDYIVALRENARQWSAHTKSRAEVNHSGKKPHPQKGTGRARQGYLGAPQYKGGGRVHAPKPKFDQHVRINRKEKRAAIRHLIIEKILDNRLHILQFDGLNEPKTQKVSKFLKSRELQGKRILFLGDGLLPGLKEGEIVQSPSQKFETFVKSIRNIPHSEFMLVPNVSGYDVIVNHDLVIMESALDQLKVILGGQH
jgi:large subunit ribosomal protein L4